MRDKYKELTENDFINGALASKIDEVQPSEDLHPHVRPGLWPISDEVVNPSFAEGSDLRKPLYLAITEREYNSIERHTKALGTNKTKWVRYAIFKQMQEEQIYFLKNKK